MTKLKILLNKIIVLVILFLFIFICDIQSFAIDTKNIHIISESDGKNLYVGGSGPNNYTTIQDAIDNASEKDIVFVYKDSSPYYENLIVNKSIYLIGEDSDTTVIDGNNISSVVNISADEVIISGFKIQNGDSKISYSAGIIISSNNNKIVGNIICYNEDGIDIRNSEFNIIIFNTIKLNDIDGIFLSGSNNYIIENEIYSNEHFGIFLLDSNNNIILHNIIDRNGYWGDTIQGGGGIDLDNSSYNTIFENNLSRNCLFSIYLVYNSKNNIIERNTISQKSMSVGIELYDSCDNTFVSGNTISNNFIGININSNNNTIEKNNFYTNVFSTMFSNPNNTWNQNYWNRPRFLPKLIFGMVEINSKWKFYICIDKNPAKRPWNLN